MSAAAAIVGEAAIAEAGDFDPRNHDSPPGARVFSTAINRLLCDDKSLDESPPDSIVGDLRDRLLACGFGPSDLPDLESVFKYFAANIGEKEDWGRVPLSIPPQHHPFVQPLRVAYETRAMVERSLAALGGDTAKRLKATTAALARSLCETRDVIPRIIATTLAIETVNGMAKTAPMTDASMAAFLEGTRKKIEYGGAARRFGALRNRALSPLQCTVTHIQHRLSRDNLCVSKPKTLRRRPPSGPVLQNIHSGRPGYFGAGYSRVPKSV